MGWFSKKLTDSEKQVALELISHLQGMFAYQQLVMEIYNDALSAVLEDYSHGDEVWARKEASLFRPTLVSKYIVPALEKKIEILQMMESKHQIASTLVSEKFHLPYKEMTAVIRIMLDRARLQYHGVTQWIQNPETDVDVTLLDEPEILEANSAISALNDLIKRVGLTTDEWLDIVQGAFNSVRTYLGLLPFSRDVFRPMYFRGLEGERVRFFSE